MHTKHKHRQFLDRISDVFFDETFNSKEYVCISFLLNDIKQDKIYFIIHALTNVFKDRDTFL